LNATPLNCTTTLLASSTGASVTPRLSRPVSLPPPPPPPHAPSTIIEITAGIAARICIPL
jgi:hypothetical protein